MRNRLLGAFHLSRAAAQLAAAITPCLAATDDKKHPPPLR